MRKEGAKALSFSTKDQYERFPYPPVGSLALPRRSEGEPLRYETGLTLRDSAAPRRAHQGIRILVAGAGTLEALVVAQMHPLACEVVAVDLSSSSLRILRRRTNWAKVARFPRRIAPLRYVEADLHEWLPKESESFDYVIASNLLQHVAEPENLLNLLSRVLKPKGLLRMVTYPQSSRIWMRETSRWLRENGLHAGDRDLVRKARAIAELLPRGHAVRSCFESQPETGTEAGLVDAFLNACERPLSPLEWAQASSRSSLRWFAEAQTETSRTQFLRELLPKTAGLDPWAQLQILDDLLELCANPVLWFSKEDSLPIPLELSLEDRVRPQSISRELILSKQTAPSLAAEMLMNGSTQVILPSRVLFELGGYLRRARALLRSSNVELEEAMQALKEKVGPRVSSRRSAPLPGLSVLDHSLECMSLPEPWADAEWKELEALLGSNWEVIRLRQKEPARNAALSDSARWLQARFGAQEPRIPVVLRKKTLP